MKMLDHDSMGGRGGRAMIVFLAYGSDELCWPQVLGAPDERGISHPVLNTGNYNGLAGDRDPLFVTACPYAEDGAEYVRRVRQ